MILKKEKVEYYLVLILFFVCFACYFTSGYFDFQIPNIEYYSLIVFLGYLFFKLLLLKEKKFVFQNFFKNIMLSIIPILVIGFIFFILSSNNSIFDFVKQAIYLLVPPIFVFFLMNSNKKLNLVPFFNIILLTATTCFIFKFYDKFNFSSLLSIDFIKSYSPFETDNEFMTFTFFACEVFFGSINKKGRCTLSLFFCILSFKRLIMVFGIIYYLYFWIKKLKFKKLNLFKDGKLVFNIIFVISVIGIIFYPIFLAFSVKTNTSDWFVSFYDTISSGRVKLLGLVLNSNVENFGLGTTSYIVKTYGGNTMASALAVHNELFRIMFESSIFGLICFVVYQFKNAFNRKYTFIFICAFFIHLSTSNFLTDFYPMVMYYLLSVHFYRIDNERILANE